MYDFLKQTTELLKDDEVINELIYESAIKTPPKSLSELATDLQRDNMEYNLRIERNYGCKLLSQLPTLYPEDEELLNSLEEFMFTCLKTYLNSLKLRKKMYKNRQLPAPDPKAYPLSRATLFEFFEACCAHYVMPEVKEELKQIYAKTGKPGNERLIEIQRNLLKLLGYDPDSGIRSLNDLPTLYPNDQELMMKMQCFIIASEHAVGSSTLNAEQEKKMNETIPRFLHYFPHIHILKERMKAANMEAMRREQDREALKNSGLLELLKRKDGKEKLLEFTQKLGNLKANVVSAVEVMTTEDKVEKIKDFRTHSLIETFFNKEFEDNLERILYIISLTEDELFKALTYVYIVSLDPPLFKKSVDELLSQGTITDENKMAMFNITASLSAISAITTPFERNGGEDFHHQGCQSCSTQRSIPNKDISKGQDDVMDR